MCSFSQENNLLKPAKWFLWASLMYSLFIVYMTVIPFEFVFSWSYIKWRLKAQLHIPFIYNDGSYASLKDTLQNIVFFIPFGFFVLMSWFKPTKKVIIVIAFLGFTMSLFVETLQLFVRHRYSSINDLITNTTGTVIGACLAYALSAKAHKLVCRVREKIHSPQILLCILSFVILLCVYLLPLDLSFSFSHFKNKLRLCMKTFFVWQNFDLELMHFMYFSIWMLLLLRVMRENFHCHWFIPVSIGLGVAFTLESLQLLILSRMPQFQDLVIAFSAIGFSILTIGFFEKCSLGTIRFFIAASTYCAFWCHTLFPFDFSSSYTPMNWLPFIAQFDVSTMLIWGQFLDSACLFVALGFCHRFTNRSLYAVVIVVSFMLLGELMQGFVVGRYPDITDVLGGYLGYMFGRIIGNYFAEKGN